MSGNRRILERLFETGEIHLKRSPMFDESPDPTPVCTDYDRVEGMMLGLAIGDSLGRTTESMLPGERRDAYGEIRDYLPNRYVEGLKGVPSDDTQLAFWTLGQMIQDRGFRPDRVAGRFCGKRIFGIGSAVREFVRNFKSGGLPWYRCGPRSAGNGALMRIAPMAIPHLRTGTSDLWVDTALSAMITHNESGSIAACIAFVRLLWYLLGSREIPEPEWWVETYVETAKELELEAYTPRGGDHLDFEGPIWMFVHDKVRDAYGKGLPTLQACNSWYSGAFLLETVPSALYILVRHGDNPEEAIVRAVNDTRDNDTIAAIVGAAVGALHGKKGLPSRWVENLAGRTAEDDDGKVFQILAEARELWWAT